MCSVLQKENNEGDLVWFKGQRRDKSKIVVFKIVFSISWIDDDAWVIECNLLRAFLEGFSLKRMMVFLLEMKVKGERNRGIKFWV